MTRIFSDDVSMKTHDRFKNLIFLFPRRQKLLLIWVEGFLSPQPFDESSRPLKMLGGSVFRIIPGRPGGDEERPVRAFQEKLFPAELLDEPFLVG